MRNILATLLLSQGTPMIVAGDEFGRTQGGNNNAYCQDNEISWVNWDMQDEGKALTDFFRKVMALRHRYPILRRNRFLTGDYNEDLDVRDLTWINANGSEMGDEQWRDEHMRCFGMLMDGRAQETGIRQRGRQATLLLILNGHHDAVEFTFPQSPGSDRWVRLIDTNVPVDEPGTFYCGDTYMVTPRSLLLFALAPPEKSERQSENAQSRS
jgi:glycogen operon protein